MQSIFLHLILACDLILIAASLFIVLYGVYTAFRVFVPARLQPGVALRWAAFPVLTLLSFVAVFTRPGAMAADMWRGLWPAVLGARAEAFLPWGPALVWFLGAAFAFLLLIRSTFRLCRSLAKCPAPPPDPVFARACAATKMLGQASLKCFPQCSGAASWGLVRNYVVVPPDFTESYSDEDRYCIYLHELTHLRRRDSRKYLAAHLLKALFWFNPFAARAAAQSLEDIELACDRQTLTLSGIAPLPYANLIIRAHARKPALPSPFSAGYESLHNRLGHIFRDNTLTVVGKTRLVPFLACVTLFLLAFFALHDGAVRDTDPPNQAIIHSMPDGTKVKIVFDNYWLGSLGTYCKSRIQALEEE